MPTGERLAAGRSLSAQAQPDAPEGAQIFFSFFLKKSYQPGSELPLCTGCGMTPEWTALSKKHNMKDGFSAAVGPGRPRMAESRMMIAFPHGRAYNSTANKMNLHARPA
ncbi:MAG: hypothetical protein IJ822_03395 [Pyramidobacter sp.]|nr:hypothetical protein [Pyramidobacter sp.]